MNGSRNIFGGLFIILLPSIVSLCSCAQSSDLKSSADLRADQLVSQMTLDEKIQLVHGEQAGFSRGAGNHMLGISRLGIPDLYIADGSVGVGNNVGEAIAMPSSIASAATWDLQLAYNYGYVIGRESMSVFLAVSISLGVSHGTGARSKVRVRIRSLLGRWTPPNFAQFRIST
jgi:beta-glucosidase